MTTVPDAMAGTTTRVAGRLLDVVSGRVVTGTVEIRDGRIARIVPEPDAPERFLIPGFVDAHVHVESSLLTPAEFAGQAVRHGTVAAVSDPHEIANVLGLAGVEFMLADAARFPFHFCFGAPSCVPATAFETSGGRLGPAEVAALLDRPAIGYLAEVMNVPGVLNGDAEVTAKLAAARDRGKPIDGHAPGLHGEALQRYVAAGISTDHECTSADEAREKIAAGLRILLREGSAAQNFAALLPVLRERPDVCMLCSDDKHPDDLLRGHIRDLVRNAIAGGVPPLAALRAATLNPARHYRLGTGLLQPGDSADFLVVDSLLDLNVRDVYIRGKKVAANGGVLAPVAPAAAAPPNRFAGRARTPAEFAIPAAAARSVRVIEVIPGQIVTGHGQARLEPTNGMLPAAPAQDLLKLAVVNRYHEAPPAVAFVRGFGLRCGALAASVAHDSHNLIAVGCRDDDLCAAINLVSGSRGGLAVVGPDCREQLPLPVAGLMAAAPGTAVAAAYSRLDQAAKTLGSPLHAPFMTLSFLALLVIPRLKLGDRGLFAADRFQFVDLFLPADD